MTRTVIPEPPVIIAVNQHTRKNNTILPLFPVHVGVNLPFVCCSRTCFLEALSAVIARFEISVAILKNNTKNIKKKYLLFLQ